MLRLLYGKRDDMPTLKERSNLLRFFTEPEAVLTKKWNDLRAFCSIMFVMPAAVGVSHWVWDYVTDPIGAQHTIGLRLLFLSSLCFPFAFKYIKDRRILELASIILGMTGLFVYILILNRIHNGMTYGIGGFTFFLFIPLLMFQGFSVRVNLISTFLFALFPQFLSMVGIAHNFQNVQYAVLIWPTAIAMMLAHFAFALNYRLRYESEINLALMSNTDPLTGVSNRRHFIPTMSNEIIRSQRLKHPVSLIILDIDNFKKINDIHGHSSGDAAICTLAKICRQMARQTDTVVRLGGDEFAILLIEANLDDALTIAERIRAAVEITPFTNFESTKIYFTVSVGVAEQPEGNSSEKWILEQADAAMYQAKIAGKNCIMTATQPTTISG